MIMTQRIASTIAASNDSIARAIREASESTIQAARITSDSETAAAEARLRQELQMFEEAQAVKDRADISLREYETLKSDLATTQKDLLLYKTVVMNILNRFEESDKESVAKALTDNNFSIQTAITPWDDPLADRAVGIIFKLKSNYRNHYYD